MKTAVHILITILAVSATHAQTNHVLSRSTGSGPLDAPKYVYGPSYLFYRTDLPITNMVTVEILSPKIAADNDQVVTATLSSKSYIPDDNWLIPLDYSEPHRGAYEFRFVLPSNMVAKSSLNFTSWGHDGGEATQCLELRQIKTKDEALKELADHLAGLTRRKLVEHLDGDDYLWYGGKQYLYEDFVEYARSQMEDAKGQQ